MSLIRLAVRHALCRALKNATLCEDRVFDSQILEIDQAAAQERRPFMIVTTDDAEGSVEGRDLISAEAAQDIVIEMSCASVVQIDGTEDIGVVVPDTDAGLEVVLDIACRQVMMILQTGGGTWGDLFRDLAPRFTNMTLRRGADASKGTRFAARQIVITATLLIEPIELPADDHPFMRYLTMAEADAELTNLVPALRAQFATTPLDLARAVQASLGLSDREIAAFGQTAAEAPTPAPGILFDGIPATGGGGALPPEE